MAKQQGQAPRAGAQKPPAPAAAKDSAPPAPPAATPAAPVPGYRDESAGTFTGPASSDVEIGEAPPPPAPTPLGHAIAAAVHAIPLLESEEDLSDLPEALQMAIQCFGLKRDHVLGHRLTEDGVVVITRGGRKLRWPGDEEKAAALTDTDKDGISRRDFPPANLFGKRG